MWCGFSEVDMMDGWGRDQKSRPTVRWPSRRRSATNEGEIQLGRRWLCSVSLFDADTLHALVLYSSEVLYSTQREKRWEEEARRFVRSARK